MPAMDIRPLEGVGAEITGVDLKALSRAEETAIRDAFAEQGVIFFRDQSLSEEDHIAFAQRFGAWDTVADHMIDRCAGRFPIAAIAERRRYRIVI